MSQWLCCNRNVSCNRLGPFCFTWAEPREAALGSLLTLTPAEIGCCPVQGGVDEVHLTEAGKSAGVRMVDSDGVEFHAFDVRARLEHFEERMTVTLFEGGGFHDSRGPNQAIAKLRKAKPLTREAMS